MALIRTAWYTLLTLLGLSIRLDSPPIEGAVGRACIGLNVRDGSVICSEDGRQTVCQVECDGENQGEFTCTEDEGWTPKLPTCAKPIEDDYDVPAPRDNGCPNDAMCAKSCRNRGHSGGKCKGSQCNCWGAPTVPTEKDDYDVSAPRDNGCPNDGMCATSCRNRGHTGGKCKGNQCNCWGAPTVQTEKGKDGDDGEALVEASGPCSCYHCFVQHLHCSGPPHCICRR